MKFSELGISDALVQKLQQHGIEEMTEIQQKCLPVLLQSKDVVGQSETGSGKTLAFAIPILEKAVLGGGIQALILTPTRELALQIYKEFLKFAHRQVHVVCVYGGVSLDPQAHGLARCEVVVATPGRLLDHMNRGNVKLGRISYLVIDEADKMLDMGFIDDIERIVRALPASRQTMLFSATIPDSIARLSLRYMRNPERVRAKAHVARHLLKQVYYDVMDNEKFSLLVHLIQELNPERAMVFCGMRSTVDLVAENLSNIGFGAYALHGRLSQATRERLIHEFHNGRIKILVATDVASRGLHIEDVTHVFNYNIPEKSDDYTHRIGRTARAGKTGIAISIIGPRDYDNFRRITPNMEIERKETPQFRRIPFRAGARRRYEEDRPFRRGGRGFHKGGDGGGHRRRPRW